MDVDEDGKKELLVGSDDYTIYVYQDEAVLSEVQETDQVTGICDMRFTKYGCVKYVHYFNIADIHWQMAPLACMTNKPEFGE